MQRQPIRALARIDHLVSTLSAVRRLLHAITDLIINVLEQCTPLLMLPDPLVNMGTICDGLTTAWLYQRIIAADESAAASRFRVPPASRSRQEEERWQACSATAEKSSRYFLGPAHSARFSGLAENRKIGRNSGKYRLEIG
jgi:hypothetical protein